MTRGAPGRKSKRPGGASADAGAGRGLGASPSKRVCLKPGLSIEIPSGPFTRAGGAPTPSSLNPITVRVPREGLTPQELRMVNEVNALNSPLTFQIEDWPAVPPMTTRSRLANATPSNFQDVQDVVSWIFAPPPAAAAAEAGGRRGADGAGAGGSARGGAGRAGGRTPRFRAPVGALGRRGARPEPLSLLDVGFGSSDIPDSARVATRHLLQKHFLTPMAAGETPPWMPDSPLGGLASSRAPLSPRFTPNEIQMLLHTLEGGAGGGGGGPPPPRPGTRRARVGAPSSGGGP